MFCTKCGTELPDGSKFCKNCGERVDISSKNENIQKRIDIIKPSDSKHKKSSFKMIWFVLVILAVIVAAAFFLRNASKLSRYQEQLELGQRYLLEEDYEAAIVAFSKAIEIDSKQAEPYLALADIYVEQGNYESAQAILEEGVQQMGENSEIVDRLNKLNNRTAEEESVTEDDESVEEQSTLETEEALYNYLEQEFGAESIQDFCAADFDMDNTL